MGISKQHDGQVNALNMAADMRRQLQKINEQVDALLLQEQQGKLPCLMRGMVSLISKTTLIQTLALELVHRLTGNGGDESAERQTEACPKDCDRHCPWFESIRRIDRWTRNPGFDPEAARLALYDYKRGLVLALDLAEHFERRLQKSTVEPVATPVQSALCLSSWMRKLVQLLDLLGSKYGCKIGPDDHVCMDG